MFDVTVDEPCVDRVQNSFAVVAAVMSLVIGLAQKSAQRWLLKIRSLRPPRARRRRRHAPMRISVANDTAGSGTGAPSDAALAGWLAIASPKFVARLLKSNV